MIIRHRFHSRNLFIFVFTIALFWSFWHVQPAHAQSPGGVPANNLELWLRGDTGLFSDSGCTTPTTNSGSVACWADQSGNNYHATQSIAGWLPTYHLGESNGYPIVRFDATDDRLFINNTLSLNAPYTVFIVYDSNSTTLTGFRGAIQRQGGGDWWVGMYQNRIAHQADGWVSVDPPVNLGQFYVTAAQNTSITSTLWVDGLVKSSGSNGSPGTLLLGAKGVSRQLDGDIAEVIVYSRYLSASELARVNSYLALKYGTTLRDPQPVSYQDSAGNVIWNATTHSTHHNNVAGIGRDTSQGFNQMVSRSTNLDQRMTITGTSATISNGEFLVWGHNNEAFNGTGNVPAGSPSPYRFMRSWRVQETGDVGNVTVSFDLSGLDLDFSNAANFGLLIDDNGNFDNATINTNATLNGSRLTFTGVNFSAGSYFTVAAPYTINTPGLAGNLALWLKGDAGTFSDSGCTTPAPAGGVVRCWADQSGNNYHATTGYIGRWPTYQPNASNGNSAVRFDNADDGLFVNNGLSLAAPYTTFSVFNTAFPNQSGWGIQGVDNNWFVGMEYTAGAFRLSHRAGTGYVGAGPAPVANQLYITAVQNNGTAATFWIDDQAIASSSNVTPPGRLGIGNAGVAWRPLGGDVVETLVYNAPLDPRTQQRIESYLALKYGLRLAGDYIADEMTVWDATANSAYHNNVAGLGRVDSMGLTQLSSHSTLAGNRVTMTGSAATVASGEFLVWGHNNGALIASADVPGGSPSPTRLNRIWKVQKTGDVGDVTVSIDLNGIPVNIVDPAHFALLVDDNGNFSNATVFTGTAVNGSVVTFSGVNFNSGTYFSVAAPYPIDVAITKSINAQNIYRGHTVTYTINIDNLSPYPATNLIVTDTMPSAFVSTGASSPDSTLVQRSGYPIYSWQIDPIASGDRITIIVTGTVEGNLSLGTTLVNTVTVASTSQNDTNLANNQAKAQGTIIARPGGVDTNLAFWLRGDQNVFSDVACTTSATPNSLIGCWQDTVSGVQYFNGTSTSPHYRTNVVNGYPAANFDHYTDSLPHVNTFDINNSTKYTVLTVFNATSTSGEGPVLQGADYVWRLGTVNGHIGHVAGGGWVSLNAAPVTPGQYYVATAQSDLSTSSFWVDGTNRTQNGAFVGTPGRMLFGYLRSTRTVEASLIGNLAEVIIYKRDLSPTDRHKIESYLALKYGITLGNGSPLNYNASDNTVIWNGAANAAYHHNVAGIGLDAGSLLNQLTSQSSNPGSRVSITGEAATIQASEFLLWGHNNASLTASTDVPSGSPSVQRLNRIWKMQETGDVGNVTISFDLSSLGVPIDFVDTAGFGLLLDDNGSFSNATVVTGATVNGSVVTFSGVNTNNGPYFSLAVPYQPDLVVTKNVTPSLALAGDTITYTLTFSNNGAGSANNVVLTDTIPAGIINTSVVSQSDVTLTQEAGSRYVWQAGTLASGQGGMITITGQVAASAVRQTVINTATIATTSGESLTSNNTASASVAVQGPNMMVLGQGQIITNGDTSPATLDDTDFGGQEVLGSTPAVHTFTISNSGQIDLTLSGTPRVALIGPDASHFSVTTLPSSPIPVNNTTTFAVTFNPQTTGTLDATVIISDTNDPLKNPYSFAIRGTGLAPDLALTKAVSPTSAQPGQVVTYTLAISNNGTYLAQGVVITDQLPISLTNVSVSSNKLITPTGSNRYVWQVADLAVAEQGLITITGQLSQPLAAGSFTNVATIDSQTFDSAQGNNSDSVSLTVVNVAPVLSAISPKSVIETQTLAFSVTGTDNNGDSLTYGLSNAPSGATIDSSGGFSWTPTEAQGLGVYTFTVVISDTGTPTLTASQQVVVTVMEQNNAPVLVTIANQTIQETNTLNFTASAIDSDIPANTPFSYSLSGAPSGASITSGGLFSWTPTEAQGPGVYTFTVQVSDTGTPVLTDSQQVVVTVAELNTAPVLATITKQSVDETTLLSFTASATDSDLPAQTLSYSVSGAPTGANITTGGLFTWTPTEAQGPGIYTFTVQVSDNGSPVLTDSQQVVVTVNDTNVAPVLAFISNKIITETNTLTFTASATDSDIPAQTLSYSLNGAPNGANITTGGFFSWTPTEAQGPGVYTLTVIANDNGTPVLTDSQQIVVTVIDTNVAPVLATISNQAIDETQPFTFTASAMDADIPVQTLTYSLNGAPSGASINNSDGLFSWTPTEAQGPGIYTFTVIASDSGTSVLTDSQQVVVTVNELNKAPVLGTLMDQNIMETFPLAFILTATDNDLPVNGLTYSVTGLPTGATLDSNSGLFSWTPSKAQGPGVYTLTFTVSDDGTPVLTDSQTIIITVADTPPDLVITKTVTAANTSVTPGDVVTYTVVLANRGGATTDIAISDVLPMGVSGTNLNQVVNIGAESSLTFTLITTATADAGYGVTVTNTASFSHTSGSSSDTASFNIIADTTPPDVSAITLITPTNGVALTTRRPSFAWSQASDSQSGVASYTLTIKGSGTSQTFTSTINSLTLPTDLALGDYTWSIQAHDADGNVSAAVTPEASFTIERAITNVYLPFVVNNFIVAPDLVVDNLDASGGTMSITLRNAGNQTVTDAFWVDLYVNPSAVPSLNQPWDTIAPAGAVWGVSKSLAPGETLTLTMGDAYYLPSISSSTFPAGGQVYVYVDSINHSTTFGNVFEQNESNNVAGPVISTASVTGPTSRAEAVELEGLPYREMHPPVIEQPHQFFLPVMVKE